MKAEFSGGNLYLQIETGRELYSLVPAEQRPPIAQLQSPNPNKGRMQSFLEGRGVGDLGIVVLLEIAESTQNVDGIDVSCIPSSATSLRDCRTLVVGITTRALGQLAIEGLIASTYMGGDAEIRIRYGVSGG